MRALWSLGVVTLIAVTGCDKAAENEGFCGDDLVDSYPPLNEECDGTDGLTRLCEECTEECTIDRSLCSDCGDGVYEPPEFCDGEDLADVECIDIGYSGGVLGCNQDCTYDESGCYRCGNGTLETGEECDDGNRMNGDGCSSACTFEESWCGNGLLDPGEACDGQAFGVATCTSLGFDGGNLSCTGSCQIDDSGCTDCGDGMIESGEQCDGENLNGQHCTDHGFVGGILACSSTCTYDTSGCTNCGNGLLDPGEACDGQAFGVATCTSLGHEGGTLICTSACAIDDASCSDCGDATIESDEECDGSNLGGQLCSTLGFETGTLACGSTCRFDTSGCSTCGNGTAEGSEECDSQDFKGASCESLGFDGGTVICDSTCSIDGTMCTECGDSIVEGDEQCDGQNLAGQTCNSLGHAGGTLACSSSCTFDESSCTAATCGDGMINAPETCEDGNLESLDGCSSACGEEPGFTCTGTGPTSCTTVCGDGVTRGLEFCDDGNPTAGDGCTGCTVDGAILAIEPDDNGVQEGVNNFSTTNANGPIEVQNGVNVIYAGRIRGPNGEGGDDDSYWIQNSDFTKNQFVLVSVHSTETGLYMPCSSLWDLTMTTYTLSGTPAGSNDNRSPTDFCPEMGFTVPAGGRMYVSISHKTDDTVVPGYFIRFEGGVCGNGIVEVGEECDGTGGPPCMATCQRVAVCGDGFLDGAEQCDDGNMTAGDQCSPTCRVESTPESEPNDDGATAVGQNDFSAANANGPYTANEIISTAISPAGDEDTFALQNPTAVPVTVTINVYNQFVGLGVSCGTSTDTVLYLRDAAGNQLQVNDNRSPTDRCSTLTVTIPPFTTQYLHLTENGDNGTTLALWMTLSFQ